VFTPETFGDETFLSEEIAISILQETKLALERCKLVCFYYLVLLIFISILFQLSAPQQMAANAKQILHILIFYLCNEHIEYAIELARNGLFSTLFVGIHFRLFCSNPRW
jgi:hypothetical protein